MAALAFGPIVSTTMAIRATGNSAAGVARRWVAERHRRRRLGHPAAVGALTALVAVAYCGFALAQYYTFRTSSFDLVIFDQAVRSYAHFHPGIAPIFNVFEGLGPNFPILGNHFSSIDAALAPLYWIHDGPQTLLVAQAVLFALAIPPLWVFTRRTFGGGPKATVAAYLVSVAYALSWPVASALAFDFHEVAFVPLLTTVALERLQAGRLRTALIALGALLLVKEDMGLFVAGIGAYLLVARPRTVPRQRLAAVCVIVAGIAATWLATGVLIPAFGGRGNFYWSYQELGSNVPQAMEHVIVHPISSLQLLVTPRVKLDTMLWLFGAFCFLPLLSPIALATVPLLVERMLSSDRFPLWWTTAYHYNAYLVVVLVCAAVDGAARLDRWLMAWREHAASGAPARTPGPARGAWPLALGCSVAMCALALVLVPRFAFGPALHPGFYQRNAKMKAAAAADAVVPNGVTVDAVDYLGPQLSARDTVLWWVADGVTAAPWVVADIETPQFTFKSVTEQQQHVALLERSGYKVAFRRDGYIVLHRAGSGGSVSSKEASG